MTPEQQINDLIKQLAKAQRIIAAIKAHPYIPRFIVSMIEKMENE